MIYATNDSDGHRIAQNAAIFAFASEAEARAHLLRGYSPTDWNLATAVIGHGTYGDCWIKIHSTPGDDERCFKPFDREQLIIQAPGQHPGGRAWWITPSEPVLVIEHIDEAVVTD